MAHKVMECLHAFQDSASISLSPSSLPHSCGVFGIQSAGELACITTFSSTATFFEIMDSNIPLGRPGGGGAVGCGRGVSCTIAGHTVFRCLFSRTLWHHNMGRAGRCLRAAALCAVENWIATAILLSAAFCQQCRFLTNEKKGSRAGRIHHANLAPLFPPPARAEKLPSSSMRGLR